MAISPKDKSILRGLAQRLADIAALPIQKERAELWRRLNRLERVRPMVQLHNATWHETGHVIQLECEDKFAREQEWGIRATLFQAENIKDDTVFEAKVHSPIFVRDQGWGITTNATVPDHVFGARHYNCVIPDGADPETMIPMAEVTLDPQATEERFQLLSDLYGGILAVEKAGVRGHWFALMDEFIQWRGLDQAFLDMADNPKWLHSWLERMCQWQLSRLDQYERLGALSLNNGNHNVGSGGLGFTDELPAKGFDGVHVRAKDQWGHATTQIFSLVSPAMHQEFGLDYEKRFLARFGLSNYGCCEPLDKKVDLIKRNLPNLRRLSMSPWVDAATGAEAIGRSLIFSWKPNPATLGIEPWDRDFIHRFLRDALEKTRGCVVEIIMKDLHTVRNEPQRMGEWADIAMQLAEEYA